MIFRIREQFWAFGDDFAITDAHGRERYYVDGKAFSWGNKLSFQDADRREVAFISQTLLSFMPRYEISINGQVFAEVVKKFTWFKREFLLDVPGPNDYQIEGAFWLHEFEFRRGDAVVARVSKKYFSWNDSYSVDIVDGEDEVAILCACIVIDQVLFDEKKKD